MKTRNGMRIISVLMTLLLVSAMAMPAMACEPRTPCGSKSIAGDPIQLTGEERDKTLDMALKNSQVKELQKQLVADGFTQKDSEAFTVPVEIEDGLRTEILIVAIPFQKDESEKGKTIAYIYNSQTRESISVVVDGPITIQGLTDCAISLAVCLVIAVGCSIPCAAVLVPDPFQLAEIKACLICIGTAGYTCRTAYCECSEWACDEGIQEACDNCD